MALPDVEKAVRRVRVHLREYQPDYPAPPVLKSAPANNYELSTRYIVVDPVLRSLGWDLSNPSQCVVERIAGSQGSSNLYPRVDYALLGRDGLVAVLVEAKRLELAVGQFMPDGSPRDDREDWARWHKQLCRYLGRFRGVQAGVLTNGQEWVIFLPDGKLWEPRGEPVRLGSRTVRANARRLIQHLGREQYW